MDKVSLIARFVRDAGRALLPVAAWCLASCAVAGPGAATLPHVRLQLKWQHQFQFAGYYAALEKGYYRESGLDVEILPAGPGEDAARQVLAGRAEYGVGTTDLLLLRQAGEPVVALAVIFQHSPLALMLKRRAGMQSLHDLVGQSVMIEPGSAELHAYLRREGVMPDHFKLLTHSAGTADLIAGRVAAMSVYVTDEPFDFQSKGIAVVAFSPRSGGIDFYGDNLFTTESELRSHPERVKAFRAASLRGWQYAMAHPEEIARLIHDRYSARHSLAHLLFEAGQMVPLLQIDLVETGHMYAGRWRHIAEVYAEMGMMRRDFDLAGFLYDPQPPPPDLRWLALALAGFFTLAAGVGAVVLHIHRTNRRLRASEERYRLVYETAPLAFVVSDRNFAITDWNQAAAKIFGWTREESIGRNLFHLLVPESERAKVEQLFATTLGDRGATYSTGPYLTKTGERILCEWHNELYRDDLGHGVGVLSLAMDVTEHQRMEDGLRQAKEIAEQALDEHRLFLGMVSHEFRSPLATIDSTSHLLELRCAYCEGAPLVGRVRRAVRRLSLFLDNCLTDNRLDTRSWQLHAEDVDLVTLVEAVVDQARQMSSAHVVVLEMGELPPHFFGDTNLLRILLRNLIENAIKYSPQGGAIRLHVGVDDGGWLLLSVADRGIGILPEERDRIFTRYFRGRQVGSIFGAGLGLNLVQRIVVLHGGNIVVESEPGRGTTMSVRLPIGREAQ